MTFLVFSSKAWRDFLDPIKSAYLLTASGLSTKEGVMAGLGPNGSPLQVKSASEETKRVHSRFKTGTDPRKASINQPVSS